jgi:hypothetical protein
VDALLHALELSQLRREDVPVEREFRAGREGQLDGG